MIVKKEVQPFILSPEKKMALEKQLAERFVQRINQWSYKIDDVVVDEGALTIRFANREDLVNTCSGPALTVTEEAALAADAEEAAHEAMAEEDEEQ